MASSNEKETNQKAHQADVGIREKEDELFAKMAKSVTPMAPDSPLTLPDQRSSVNPDDLPWEHADAIRERIKRRFPRLTDSDLDELMM